MSRTILIADDDRMTVQLIMTRLRKSGWAVSTAYDAMQVHMFAQRDLPDLVLIDVNMPGGGGLAALQKIKASAKTATIPVVAMSIADDPALPERALAAGADAFLKKPVDFGELDRAIGELLGDAS